MITLTSEKNISIENISEFIQPLVNNQGEMMEESITIDLTRLEFIYPPGVVLLSNIIEWIESKGSEVTILIPKNYKETTKKHCPFKYLDDLGFIEKYIGERLFENSELRSTTIGIQNVRTENVPQWLDNTLIPRLAQMTNLPAEVYEPLHVPMSEIFNNIKDHSEENIATITGQYFPNQQNKVQLAVADFGVGIPFRIKGFFGEMNDSEAIKKAIERNVTTESTPKNRGYGLDNIVNSVVSNNAGKVTIVSGKGMIVIEENKENNEKKITSEELKEVYPGTFFLIELDVEKLKEEELSMFVEEEFEW